MAVGVAQAMADAILNLLSGTAISGGAHTASHVEPHTADPGATGQSGQTTAFGSIPQRVGAITWGSITGTGTRQRAITGTHDWPTAVSGAVITHVSVWGAATLFTTFRFSAALTTSRTVAAGDILRLSSLSFSFQPVATA